jgi:hypothetical protein
MLDHNPGKSMADLKNALPKTRSARCSNGRGLKARRFQFVCEQGAKIPKCSSPSVTGSISSCSTRAGPTSRCRLSR